MDASRTPPEPVPPPIADMLSGVVVAGQSALPAFLSVEAWARARTAEGDTAAAARLAEGQAQAEQVRADGEAALRQAVIEGEREALRDVESRSRDRVSEARRAVEAWVQASERAAEAAVAGALQLICGEAGPAGGADSTTAAPSERD